MDQKSSTRRSERGKMRRREEREAEETRLEIFNFEKSFHHKSEGGELTRAVAQD
jgi:hypothetical protein